MEYLSICSFCGKQFTGIFSHCPDCGAPCRDGSSFEAVLDRSLEKMRKVVLVNQLRKLDTMERVLRKLDNELTEFLSLRPH